MSALNDQKNSMRVSDLQQQVQEVRTVMTDNVTRVMERGERLEDLDQRAENLQQSVRLSLFSLPNWLLVQFSQPHSRHLRVEFNETCASRTQNGPSFSAQPSAYW